MHRGATVRLQVPDPRVRPSAATHVVALSLGGVDKIYLKAEDPPDGASMYVLGTWH